MTRPRATDITSFKTLRQHLRKLIDQARESGRPLFVTTHGRPDAVLLSPDAYDELAERAAYLEELLGLEAARREVVEGRTRPAREAVLEVAEKLGLRLGE